MRVKESDPTYKAARLFEAANGAMLEALGHDRHRRPARAARRRKDARAMRALARHWLKETPRA